MVTADPSPTFSCLAERPCRPYVPFRTPFQSSQFKVMTDFFPHSISFINSLSMPLMFVFVLINLMLLIITPRLTLPTFPHSLFHPSHAFSHPFHVTFSSSFHTGSPNPPLLALPVFHIGFLRSLICFSESQKFASLTQPY